MRYDLLLVHAPSIYDFRKKSLYYGPISDVVPSSPLFDLYPIGFLSMLTYLTKKGFKIGIINIAARMILDPKVNVEELIKNLSSEVYGIDLHWLAHAQGAIEIAKIIKQYHADKKIVLGGLSSTIFWEEILRTYNFVDFVVLGDTAEEPMKLLLEFILDGKGSLESIPNIAWKDKNNKIKSNYIRYVPESLDEFSIDYSIIIKECLKSKDLLLNIPFANFISEPIGASISFKGCVYNCLTCGGSRFAYSKFFKRKKLAIKSPKKIFEEVKSLTDYMNIPVFILGDLQFLGEKNIEAICKMLHDEKIDNTLFFEFFCPASKEKLSLIKKASERIIIQLSPETQDEDIRFAFGKKYNNKQLNKFVENVLEIGFDRLDLYFMIGLPNQDYNSSINMPKFIKNMLIKIPKTKNFVDFFVAPLAPFLDPGSKVFVNPKGYGYKLLYKTLEEHRIASSSSKSWKDSLNYETNWMSKDEIFNATYNVAEDVIKIKIKNNIIKEEEGLRMIEIIKETKEFMNYKKEVIKRITDKETVLKSDLYPTKNLLLLAKPKLIITLLKGSK